MFFFTRIIVGLVLHSRAPPAGVRHGPLEELRQKERCLCLSYRQRCLTQLNEIGRGDLNSITSIDLNRMLQGSLKVHTSRGSSLLPWSPLSYWDNLPKRNMSGPHINWGMKKEPALAYVQAYVDNL
jgi:hypothetical protein